jgi:uncharacterized protein YqeY
MEVSLKARLDEDIKTAMREQNKSRLTTLRMLKSAIRQIEIDSRALLDDAACLTLIQKQIKQRQESISQYQQGSRSDLAAVEQAEIEILQSFLPPAISTEAISVGIQAAIAELGANSIRDMSKVMAHLAKQWAGRADMAQVGALVKQQLS